MLAQLKHPKIRPPKLKPAAFRRQTVVLMVAVAVLLGVALWALALVDHQPRAQARSFEIRSLISFTQVILGSLLSSIVAAAFVGVIVDVVHRNATPPTALRVLDPAQSRVGHDEALATTRTWYHDGDIGDQVRTSVLPALVEAAARRQVTHRAVLVILDPTDDQLCERFATNWTGTLPDGRDRCDATDVKIELLATIIRAAHAARAPHMEVAVYTRNRIGWSRLDVSDTVAFRTDPDPHRPTVAYVKGAVPGERGDYERAVASFHDLQSAETPLALDGSDLPGSLDDIDAATVRRFLDRNDLGHLLTPTCDPLVAVTARFDRTLSVA